MSYQSSGLPASYLPPPPPPSAYKFNMLGASTSSHPQQVRVVDISKCSVMSFANHPFCFYSPLCSRIQTHKSTLFPHKPQTHTQDMFNYPPSSGHASTSNTPGEPSQMMPSLLARPPRMLAPCMPPAHPLAGPSPNSGSIFVAGNEQRLLALLVHLIIVGY